MTDGVKEQHGQTDEAGQRVLDVLYVLGEEPFG
jgi:hypothetical protein